MQAGIQVSSFKPVLKTVDEVNNAFKKISAMGCRIIQIQWIDPSVPDEAIGEAVRAYKLDCISTQDRYEVVTGDFEHWLRQNAMWGSRDICISGIPENMRSVEGINGMIEEIKALIPKAKDNGQSVSFHCRSQEYDLFGGVSGFERIADAVPDMNVCFDMYHALRAKQNIPALLKKYAGRIEIVHYKEENAEGSLVPAGQGIHDWKAITEVCENCGAKYALAEQEKWTGDPFEILGAAYKYIAGITK